MPEQLLQQAKSIKKSDLLSGAAITGVITFVILTWSKTLPTDSAFAPYVTEQTISFVAGLASYLITIGLAFSRYEVSLILHERDYTKKIKYLEQIMAITTCPEAKRSLEEQKNVLLTEAAKAIIEEKI
ncbi:hypothetical protein BS017_RS23185 [Vibrio parahaemolyticus]|nr:hypothetical protein [Vibrio parahaemolyticus]EJG2002879.1 hypothetical protein [Vibrio parahaemolyticus]EJG2040289.1 hypothetical protein [Vibrio parahaemolyticus]EJG2044943.1 hypothetical protein [Vibrio parahaemolyticus]EJG2235771.1 hypothetical protein [Vibrio parahaemolyticus]